MSSKVQVGIISCIAPMTKHKEQRILMHETQVKWLHNVVDKWTNQYNCSLDISRVEQGWEPETKARLSSDKITSLEYADPIPPGAARNVLLRNFYASDSDWLICLDDDHVVENAYESELLFLELNSEQSYFNDFLEEGILITETPGYWRNTPERVKTVLERRVDPTEFWYLRKISHPGSMPIACIPNIAKYQGLEIYFSECQIKDGMAEDLKFMIDWILAGGRVLECNNLIGKSAGGLEDSSIFDTDDSRFEHCRKAMQHTTAYLHKQLPGRPHLWRSKHFFQDCNDIVPRIIPRRIKIDTSTT